MFIISLISFVSFYCIYMYMKKVHIFQLFFSFTKKTQMYVTFWALLFFFLFFSPLSLFFFFLLWLARRRIWQVDGYNWLRREISAKVKIWENRHLSLAIKAIQSVDEVEKVLTWEVYLIQILSSQYLFNVFTFGTSTLLRGRGSPPPLTTYKPQPFN